MIRDMLQPLYANEGFGGGGSTILLLLIPVAIIFFIYGYLLVLSLRSFRVVKQNLQAITFGKVFYFMISLALLGRTVSYIVMIVEMLSYYNNDSKPDLVDSFFGQIFLALNYLPDLFVIPSFSIYGWLVLLLFLLGLVQLTNFNHASTNLKNKYFLLYIILVVLIEIGQGIGFGIFWVDKTDYTFQSYLLLNSIMNLFTAGFVIASQIIFHFAFSGVPFKADFHQKRFKRMNNILVFWGFGRAFKAIINIVQKDQLIKLWDNIIIGDTNSVSNILAPLFLILQLFVSEIMPLLLVNDSKILEALFVKSEYNNAHTTSLQPGLIQPLRDDLYDYVPSPGLEEPSYAVQRTTDNGKSLKKNSETGSIICDQKEVLLLQKDEHDSKEMLGAYYNAEYRGEKIRARVIKPNKMTLYLAEEIKREVSRFTQLRNPHVHRVRGCYTQGADVTVYYDYVERGSLYDMLHRRQENSQKLDLSFKLQIAIQVAQGLKYLHSRDPHIVHCHLHPVNIWFDKDYTAKITDYGLANLKKYVNIMEGYSTVTQYTAPEIFSGKGKIIFTDNPAADVFSFGMILWELVTEQIPFEGLETTMLHQIICEENSRPKIPVQAPEPLQNLIRACWQQDYKLRPNFVEIIEVLEEELY